jgi:pimeloyl-ACP methyl ester carboxylesterase
VVEAMMQSSTSAADSTTIPWRQGYLHIDGLSVRYQMGGQGPAVLLLHGWGGNIESFTPVFDDLVRFYTVYALDLPGFGHSSLPSTPWGVADYAALTLQVMDRLKLEQPHLICHSFGGRVAIMLATHHPNRVGKLVLVDSAGVRSRRTTKAYLKGLASRVGKWLATYGGGVGKQLRDALYQRLQSQDYANAGPLRSTLVKVVNEDLMPLLPRIKSPTLLVWGEHDRDVPLSAAKVMVQLIPGAQLVVFENAGHFAYLDQFNRFRLLVGRFLRAADKPVEGSPV